MSTFFRNVARL